MLNAGQQHRPRPETARRVPVLRPLLPRAESILPYLQRIDDNRFYSNAGPLEQEFEARLAAHFGVGPQSVSAVSSGTMGLVVALRAVALTGRRKCLLPAWTFAATPLAVMQAGLDPVFVDVDADTWALSPDDIATRGDLADVAAILPVAPLGAPPDIEGWNRFMAETGLPVVIDAAACFDAIAVYELAPLAAMPLVVSLHATKAFGVGEGGIIISSDAEVVSRCRQLRTFGFAGTPVSSSAGFNAKLSEYHAAVGLAALDEWPAKRDMLATARDYYAIRLRSVPGIHLMPQGTGDWVAATFNIRADAEMGPLAAMLDAEGIETRPWWQQGCHRQPAFAHVPHDPLPVTEHLAAHVLGLPMAADISAVDIDRVCTALAR